MLYARENDLKKNNYLNYYVFIAFPVEFLLGSYINVMFLKTPDWGEEEDEEERESIKGNQNSRKQWKSLLHNL